MNGRFFAKGFICYIGYQWGSILGVLEPMEDHQDDGFYSCSFEEKVL